MHNQKRTAIGLLLLGLILCAVQAGVWARSTASARTETEKQNIEQHYQPNEIAGLAGAFFLIAAAVVASIPRRPMVHARRRSVRIP